jgi:hypothetical protein
VLRRIFGPKRDKVKEGWRKLHNEELHNLQAALFVKYNTNYQAKEGEMGRECSAHGKEEECTQDF